MLLGAAFGHRVGDILFEEMFSGSFSAVTNCEGVCPRMLVSGQRGGQEWGSVLVLYSFICSSVWGTVTVSQAVLGVAIPMRRNEIQSLFSRTSRLGKDSIIIH